MNRIFAFDEIFFADREQLDEMPDALVRLADGIRARSPTEAGNIRMVPPFTLRHL